MKNGKRDLNHHHSKKQQKVFKEPITTGTKTNKIYPHIAAHDCGE